MTRTPPSALLRDTIYKKIRSAILSCELPPGAAIREQHFAEAFAVSKSPVRDALHRLQADGLVEVLPRKGYRVKTISLVDALELYEMRILLESACVERTVRTASHSDLCALDKYRSHSGAKNLSEWVAYNREFHFDLAALCGNNRLIDAAHNVILAFDRLTWTSFAQIDHLGIAEESALEDMEREHVDIIDALQSRDPQRVSSLVRLHIEASREGFLQSYRAPRSDAPPMASSQTIFQMAETLSSAPPDDKTAQPKPDKRRKAKSVFVG